MIEGRMSSGRWGKGCCEPEPTRKSQLSEEGEGERKERGEMHRVVDGASVAVEPAADLPEARGHGVNDLALARGSDVEEVVAVLGGDVDELVEDLLDGSGEDENDQVKDASSLKVSNTIGKRTDTDRPGCAGCNRS